MPTSTWHPGTSARGKRQDSPEWHHFCALRACSDECQRHQTEAGSSASAARMCSSAAVLGQNETATLWAAESKLSRTGSQHVGTQQQRSEQQDGAEPDLLDGLVQEGFEGCDADVPYMCCDAPTPLHKFDIVEVVLHSTKVGKAKGCECCIPPPVNVLPPLDDLSSTGRYGWHGVKCSHQQAAACWTASG